MSHSHAPVETGSGEDVRAYKLAYEQSPVNGRSRLTSVQQFGSDVAINETDGSITGGTALPARTFAYQNDANGHVFTDWP